MIWCVDDDKTICDIEVYALKQTGFEAKGFSDGISMLEQLKVEKPDLIILDVMLPEKDGLEVLKELKSSSETSKIPVIMATAKGTEMDKVSGLDNGADDYLVKPFGVMEMVSRVKAVLRRVSSDFDSVLNVGKISLITKEHVVKVDGEKVSLTLKEYELLKLFNKYLRGGRVQINPVEGVNADKSLKRTNWDFNYRIPDYEQMVAEMAEWIYKHKELYPHYSL